MKPPLVAHRFLSDGSIEVICRKRDLESNLNTTPQAGVGVTGGIAVLPPAADSS